MCFAPLADGLGSVCLNVLCQVRQLGLFPVVSDVDGDGNITLRDAMFIFQAKATKRTLSGVSALCADTDKDGKTTLRDAMFILQYKANKRDADFNIK